MMDFRESIRAHLVDDCPEGQDVDLPTDGQYSWALGWACIVDIVLVLCACGGILWWVTR